MAARGFASGEQTAAAAEGTDDRYEFVVYQARFRSVLIRQDHLTGETWALRKFDSPAEARWVPMNDVRPAEDGGDDAAAGQGGTTR